MHAQLEYLFNDKEYLDHERMATQYMQITVNSLRNQFSTLDDFSAKSLVFSGLKKTNTYKELSLEIKNRMYEMESNFKNRIYGTYCD